MELCEKYDPCNYSLTESRYSKNKRTRTSVPQEGHPSTNYDGQPVVSVGNTAPFKICQEWWEVYIPDVFIMIRDSRETLYPELEARLGKFDKANSSFTNGVSRAFFENKIRCMENYSQWTRSTPWERTEEWIFKDEVRIRKSPGGYSDFVKKVLVRNFDIQLPSGYDARIVVKTESPCTMKTGSPVWVRFKERKSFFYKNTFRYDFSKVYEGLSVACATRANPKYEIELEFTGLEHERDDRYIAKSLFMKLNDLLKNVVMDSNFGYVPTQPPQSASESLSTPDSYFTSINIGSNSSTKSEQENVTIEKEMCVTNLRLASGSASQTDEPQKKDYLSGNLPTKGLGDKQFEFEDIVNMKNLEMIMKKVTENSIKFEEVKVQKNSVENTRGVRKPPATSNETPSTAGLLKNTLPSVSTNPQSGIKRSPFAKSNAMAGK